MSRWTAGWRPWPAGARPPSPPWPRPSAGRSRAHAAAWSPASRAPSCAASSTRPGCRPAAWTPWSWTATCRWAPSAATGHGTARTAWRPGTAAGCWPGGCRGRSPARPTACCSATPARPAAGYPASAPAPPGSTCPGPAQRLPPATPTAALICARPPSAASRRATRCLPPRTGPPPCCRRQGQVSSPRWPACSLTWASSRPGYCGTPPQVTSPTTGRTRLPPRRRGGSSPPPARLAISRLPAPRSPVPWPPPA